MKTEKLRIKDLVTIGVFTVIYFVLMFASGMIGIVPILYLAYPTLAGIITGIVIMLFMTKVHLPYSTLGFVVSLCKFCWLKTRLLNWLKQAVWVTII